MPAVHLKGAIAALPRSPTQEPNTKNKSSSSPKDNHSFKQLGGPLLLQTPAQIPDRQTSLSGSSGQPAAIVTLSLPCFGCLRTQPDSPSQVARYPNSLHAACKGIMGLTASFARRVFAGLKCKVARNGVTKFLRRALPQRVCRAPINQATALISRQETSA